jgi:hypothetical protein
VVDDNLADDDPDLLNLDIVESEITCRTSSQLQRCWPDSGKSGGRVWDSGWSIFAPLTPALPSLYLSMRMSKVAFGWRCSLPPSFFCHWPSIGLFGLIILGGRSSPLMTSFPLELDNVHIRQNQVLIICMTQDQLFHTYGQKCSQITKCHE